MSASRQLSLGALALLACLPALVHGVDLRGKIVRVGFPGSTDDASGNDCYRPDSWIPVLVELTNTDGDLFLGTLQMYQLDRDGDEVLAHPTTSVSVRGTRNYYVYLPPGVRKSPELFGVQVFGADGRLITLSDDQGNKTTLLQPARPVGAVPHYARVILDISWPPLNQLAPLPKDPRVRGKLFVLRISSSGLPDNVAGLDMVDTIIWDGADPAGIDPAQLDALIAWVERGGTLILGVSRNWEVVAKSRLGELLPARLTGTTTTNKAEELKEELFGSVSPELDPPLVYTPVKAANLHPEASSIAPLDPGPEDRIFLSQRPCGRGRILLSTALFQDLLARGTQSTGFLPSVLAVRKHPPRNDDQPITYGSGIDLFRRNVEQVIAFRLATGLFFLFAILFAGGYILLATAGSWMWLKQKKLAAYSWPVFAVVALLASAASLGAVQLVRGVGHQVQQLTILDAHAGSSKAGGLCFVGLKTPTHTTLDLWLPENPSKGDDAREIPAGLMPLSADPESFDTSSYAAGQRYEAVPALGQLRGVPLRATLKQFQGVWQGELLGKLTASLQRRDSSSTFRLSDQSWIKNGLDVDLQNCNLFIATRNIGAQGNWADRSRFIYVYPIGTLQAGATVTWAKVLERLTPAQPKNAQNPDQPPVEYTPRSLFEWQRDWLGAINLTTAQNYGRPFRAEEQAMQTSPDSVVPAMLLITVLSELDEREFATNYDLTPTRARHLDRSDALTVRTALLVAFGKDDAGPARLCYRTARTEVGGWRAINPSEAKVVYRFSIPLGGTTSAERE